MMIPLTGIDGPQVWVNPALIFTICRGVLQTRITTATGKFLDVVETPEEIFAKCKGVA